MKKLNSILLLVALSLALFTCRQDVTDYYYYKQYINSKVYLRLDTIRDGEG